MFGILLKRAIDKLLAERKAAMPSDRLSDEELLAKAYLLADTQHEGDAS
jgi:hypothetical protein